MDNIYNFLRSAIAKIQTESINNKSFVFLLLLSTSIPFSLGINNVFFILFIVSTLFFALKNKKITFSKQLFLPIVLYIIMMASFFWSIDQKLTLRAIPKEIALFLIPMAFMVLQPILEKTKQNILKYYSYSIVLIVIYYLLRAVVRYFITKDTSVFFYHGEYDNDTGLVPKELNAIHVSVFVALAFFYFYTKSLKNYLNSSIQLLLFGFIILLSSKNIILVYLVLISIHFFFFSISANKMRLRNMVLFVATIVFVFSFGKLKERFQVEFQTNTQKSINSNVIKNAPQGVHNVSIYEAWTNEKFTPNDFFPGTAFRVYQTRLFFEFLKEDKIFLNGFGLNASIIKLKEKEKQYNLYPGYGSFNFHNQYTQVFAELGIFGFIVLITILFINLKNAFKNKDFMHIAFAVLMISLFLTESFLWRQRGVMFFTLFYCVFNSTKKE